MRLYQWGHYTLRLDDWKYPPSGYILGGPDIIDKGGKTNEIDNSEAFDKKYSVTDPWGVYSSDMSANFFQTFNQGGSGPSPVSPTPSPIISPSGDHHKPIPSPAPSPAPAPTPAPTTTTTKNTTNKKSTSRRI